MLLLSTSNALHILISSLFVVVASTTHTKQFVVGSRVECLVKGPVGTMAIGRIVKLCGSGVTVKFDQEEYGTNDFELAMIRNIAEDSQVVLHAH